MAGDKAVIGELEKALTPDGAASLINDWSGGPLPDWAKQNDNLVSTVRSSAAIGLVLSGDPEGIKMVEQLYSQVHSRIGSDTSLAQLHSGLVDALATRDAIAQYGKSDYLNSIGDKETEMLHPYFAKYR